MTTPSTRKPNVIWVFGDQHRAQALSHMGDPNVNTPEIDRLSNDGFCSTAAVMGTPLCCPARGSILTGRYPHACVPGHEERLPEGQATIATPFKEAGYHTALFGKRHLDGFKERNGRGAFHTIPPERRGGFDDWVAFENNNSQWDCWVHGHRNGKEVPHYRLPGYETDELTSLLIDHIQQRAKPEASNQPFFTILSVQPPHDPYVAPAQYMARHNPATLLMRPNVPNIKSSIDTARRDLAGYYAMIENLDDNLGRVRAALAATGLAENTHIVFFSDHGDMHGSHGQFRKTSPWEESIRVPFAIGGLQTYGHHRGRTNLLVNHVDIAPTTLGLCGIEKPSWMQGTDFSGWRVKNRPKAAAPDSAFLQLVMATRHQDSTDRPWRGVVTADGWKYVCVQGSPYMLFNLSDDPYEQANHVFNSRYGAQRTKLHERLAQWIADTGDKFELPVV
ncbi:sulfatase [soil metagenome]